jgi:phenylacetic acid degradation protein paaN
MIALEWFKKHESVLQDSIAAEQSRIFYTPFPENPRLYPEGAEEEGKLAFLNKLNTDFDELLQMRPSRFEGEEISPWLGTGIGIRYPIFPDKILALNAKKAQESWSKTDIDVRSGVLLESLERAKLRFFEIAHATMHTTGQSLMMAFQASGPHAADRALEAICVGYQQLSRYPKEVSWEKPQSKSTLIVKKKFKAKGRGIGLVIGCSTFPTWNSLPGIFANLITGNSVLVKPHPKAVLPIALYVGILQKTLADAGFDPLTVQLACDTVSFPITRDLAEHPDVAIIDYTGNSGFGNWIEAQALMGNKVVFTEKTGINSVLLHSTNQYATMIQNLAIAITLYSGQMCTSPQNFMIPAAGISTNEGIKSIQEFGDDLHAAIQGILLNTKIGASTSCAIQNDKQIKRRSEALIQVNIQHWPELASPLSEEFPEAVFATPALIKTNAQQLEIISKEWFGPIVFLVETNGFEQGLNIAQNLAKTHGSISCGCYSTDESMIELVAETMENVGVQVCFNYHSGVYVNQNAAFSDFHLTGGNPAGNGVFTNSEFLSRRYFWVGHRFG